MTEESQIQYVLDVTARAAKNVINKIRSGETIDEQIDYLSMEIRRETANAITEIEWDALVEREAGNA